MQNNTDIEQLVHAIDQQEVHVEKEIHGLPFQGIDMVAPHALFFVCLRGNARAMYDMQMVEITQNTMVVIIPGHVLMPISCSDDYVYARLAITQDMFQELNAHSFSRGYEKFQTSPACLLTDIQAKRIMAHFELLDAIALHDTDDLQFRRQMLISQLAIAYEFINYYRHEQDRQWNQKRSAAIYTQFSDLVVKHYRENRNVNFYAQKLGYEQRYFSKLFRQFSDGMSPLAWIQQYVATQAKLIMDRTPRQTVKETALQLGFLTTANFCRYFKRATGIYPQEYKSSHHSK